MKKPKKRAPAVAAAGAQGRGLGQNHSSEILPHEVVWALQNAPDLASDIWLRAAGHAPLASLDPLQFARAAARRDRRAGGSRGPAVVHRMTDEIQESHYLDDHNDDPLSVLIAWEDAIENDGYCELFGRKFTTPPSTTPRGIAARAAAAHRTRRRGQQLEARRAAARRAGQAQFAGLGWGGEK